MYYNPGDSGIGNVHNYNLTINLKTVASPQKFCMRVHVSNTLDDPTPYLDATGTNYGDYLHLAQYDLPDDQGYKGFTYGQPNDLCFTVNPPTTVTGPSPQCNQLTGFSDPGAADGATDKLHSASYVRVTNQSGSQMVPDPRGTAMATRTFTAANFTPTYPAPSYAGTYIKVSQSASAGTLVYPFPAESVNFYTVREIHNVDGVAHTVYGISIPPGGDYFFPNPTNPNPPYGFDGNKLCYHAVCTGISVAPQAGDPVVVAGHTMWVTVNIYNDGPSDLPNSFTGYPGYGGDLLQANWGDENGNGSYWTGFQEPPGGLGTLTGVGYIPRGWTVSYTFPLAVPGSATPYSQPIVAHPTYSSLFAFGAGSACATTVNAYVPFSLNADAPTVTLWNSKTSSVSTEDPDQIFNTTSATNNGPPVSEHVTSWLTYATANCGSITQATTPYNTSNDGPFNNGVKTYLYNNYEYGACGSPAAGDTYCAFINVPYPTGYVGPGGPTDIYPTSTGTPLSTCPKVVNRPFYKNFNSGVLSGGSFGGAVCPAGSGIIGGWNNDSGTQPDFGASGQLSNIATGDIVGHASNQSSFANDALGLSFANTTHNSGAGTDGMAYSPNLGGDLGGCLNLTNPSAGAGATTLAAGSTIGATSIAAGQNKTIYVPGDVFINGNITYQHSSDGTWNSTPGQPNSVPSFNLIATGDIFIAPGVTQLDGVYTAQGTGGSSGEIYTCAQGISHPIPQSFIDNAYSTCNKQLVVNGAFVDAKTVMMRTFGSLRDETPLVTVGPGPNIHTSVLFRRYDCSGTWSAVVQHEFLQNSGNSQPPLPGGCSTSSGHPNLGFILPFQGAGTCDTPGTVLLWEASDPTINNGYFYTTSTGEPHTTPVGCVPTGPAPNTEPVFRVFEHTHGGHLWTVDPVEYTSYLSNPNITNEGAPFWVYTNAGQGGVAGSIITSVNLPSPLICSNNGGQVVSTSCAAEVFILSPELYLSAPQIGQAGGGSANYDSITSLPPVL